MNDQHNSSNHSKNREKDISQLIKLNNINNAISNILNGNGLLSNMLQHCLTTIVTQLEADIGICWIFNKDNAVLELQASVGLNNKMESHYRYIPLGSNLAGCIAQTKQPYLTNSLITDALMQEKDWVKQESLVAFAGCPLLLANKLIAVWAIFSQNPFPEDLIADLFPVSQLMALGVERKQLEQKLQRCHTFLNIIQDIFIIIDLEDQVLLWNSAAEKFYGWTAAEATGKNIFDLLYKGKEYLFQHIKAKTLAIREGQWVGELNQIQRDGKEVITENRWTLTHNESGQPISICIVTNDISDKKRLTAQLMRAQRLELFGTLAGGIAHDLNNILSPVLISSQILKMRTSDEKSHEILKTVENSTQRGVDLIKQILTFTRGLDGEPSIIQLRHLVTDIIKLLKEIFPKNIELRTHTPIDTLKLSAEFTQIYQAVLNLCVNARDAMPSGGVLTVTLESLFINESEAIQYNSTNAKVGYYVVITVADTGIGIPNEVLDKIYDPFFTTKEVSTGTGLGLSIVQHVVSNHNGFLTVKSNLNKGTTFKIYLPAIAAPELIVHKEIPCQLPVGNGELILIVDDEFAICDITAKTLEAFNYRTIMAADGIEAIDLYLKHKDEIRLVLTDMAMPMMNGVQMATALQKIDAQLKIIITSGVSISELNKEIAQINIEQFLPKPYTAEILLNAIANALKS